MGLSSYKNRCSNQESKYRVLGGRRMPVVYKIPDKSLLGLRIYRLRPLSGYLSSLHYPLVRAHEVNEIYVHIAVKSNVQCHPPSRLNIGVQQITRADIDRIINP